MTDWSRWPVWETLVAALIFGVVLAYSVALELRLIQLPQ